jgi:predicted 3-demethylubiquinone-9 3-methyltransferase (glyoxalase superfamily)
MQTLSPCLWFDGKAEEAAKFYTSIFKNSRITQTTHHGDAGPGPKGSVLTVTFELGGQSFKALNGGPEFKFNHAISLMVDCEDQAEIDRMTMALTEGGKQEDCGWVQDRYGLSWQLAPKIMQELISDKHPDRQARVMAAMMKMKKLDLAALERAYEG